MKTKLFCLSLAACVFASCDKSETKTKPDETSSKKPLMGNQTGAPANTEKPAPEQHATSEANTNRPVDPPLSQPVDASMIRPSGTLPDDASWQTLTAEQKFEKFKSSGIARMPRYASEQILADATKAGEAENQVLFITEQAAAWLHINEFKESGTGIPDHMKMALLEKLSTKHGTSWIDMIPELDEQIAASVKVDELRSKGISGMSLDESHEFFIKAIEKYGPDYKAILAAANQNARK